MKKKSLLIILIIIVSCNQISNTKDLVLENEILMSKSTSIDYDLLLINKPFSQEEKNIQKENVRFIRIDNDSLVGGSFWIKNDSLEHYYDAKNLYEINHKNNTIIKFSPYKNQEWSIYGSSITGAVKSGKYFLKKNY